MAEAVILITLWLLWSMSSIRRRQIRHCGVFGLSAAATPTSSAERPPVDGQEHASKFTLIINLKTAKRSGVGAELGRGSARRRPSLAEPLRYGYYGPPPYYYGYPYRHYGYPYRSYG
jgi:hypothetical protein